MNIQFATQSYQARALPLAAQQCVNMFVEAAPQDAKDTIVLYGAPGIKSFASVAVFPARGAHVMAGIPYVITGNKLRSIAQDGTVTTYTGTIEGGSRVAMEDNGIQLCIVNGTSTGYIYTVDDGLKTITNENFLAADTVTYQDGYFIFNRAGTGIFFLSNLNDGLTYTATDFATAEGDPDNLVAVISNHRELWLFGEKTTEIWFNSGDADFPFDRLSGTFIERGCGAAFTPQRIDNTLYWLGEDRVVYRAAGYTPERISTHSIEQEIEKYLRVDDAFAFVYTMAGHKFYVLTFPTASVTWVYDASTGLWHERDSRDAKMDSYGRWRAETYVRAYGKHIVGDMIDGSFGELDWDTFTEYGNTLQGLATSPPYHKDRKRVFISRFELDVESGVGLTSGQGSDPQIQLDYSDDGGRTWSMRKPWRTMGKIGKYRQRLRWLRMGRSRNRVFRIEISDPVKRSIVSAHMDATVGTS